MTSILDDQGADDDVLGGGLLDFVFQKWLDPQLLTDHDAPTFGFELRDGRKLEFDQDTFVHTETNDRTGAVVWDDAVVLARYLEKNKDMVAGLRVVEVGSGTGFVGIVAGALGAHAMVTDRDCMVPLMATNCTKNVTLSDGSARAESLDWFKPLPDCLVNEKPSYILASGVVYTDKATPALLRTLRQLGDQGATLLLAIDFRFECDFEKLGRGSRYNAVGADDDHKARDQGNANQGGECNESFVAPIVHHFLDLLEEEWAIVQIPKSELASDAVKGSVTVLRATLRPHLLRSAGGETDIEERVHGVASQQEEGEGTAE